MGLAVEIIKVKVWDVKYSLFSSMKNRGLKFINDKAAGWFGVNEKRT